MRQRGAGDGRGNRGRRAESVTHAVVMGLRAHASSSPSVAAAHAPLETARARQCSAGQACCAHAQGTQEHTVRRRPGRRQRYPLASLVNDAGPHPRSNRPATATRWLPAAFSCSAQPAAARQCSTHHSSPFLQTSLSSPTHSVASRVLALFQI